VPGPGRLRVGLLAGGCTLLAVACTPPFLDRLAPSPRLLPSLVVATVAGVALALRPAWLLPVFVALVWAALGTGAFAGFSPVDLGVLAFLAVAAGRVVRDPGSGRIPGLVVAALLAADVLAALFSPEPTLGNLPRELAFLPIAAVVPASMADVRRTAIALTLAGLILGVGAVWSVLRDPIGPFQTVHEVWTPDERSLPRAAGPFGDPNFFALSLAALVPITMAVSTWGAWHRVLGLVATAGAIGGILAAGSRGALLAALVALMLVAVASHESRRVALVMPLCALLALPAFADQVTASQSREVSGRATEMQIGIEMFGDHPFAGVGPTRYSELYRDYARRFGDDPRPTRAAHSLPVEIAAEQGVLGLIGWGVAAAIVVGTVRRRRLWHLTLGRALAAGAITYLVGSLFLHGSDLRLLFLLAGLLLALGRLAPSRQAPA
jgi:O-antigen ligase/polysaccharide polymerase Wzy-like membrane protein